MAPVTPSSRSSARAPREPSPLGVLDGLLNLERSTAFHAGAIEVGLERMAALLEQLGPIPPARVAVHVAGSEGKTSTTRLVSAGLHAAGLSTGSYTSPHLVDARERLCVDGRPVSDEVLALAVARVLSAAGRLSQAPTWFEAMTATAALAFAQRSVSAVVWEAGLGGRLDATRLLPADLCVVTSVSLEHTAVLGDSLGAIAREKAGIVRPGCPLVLGAGIPAEASEVLCEVAAAHDAPVAVLSALGDEPVEATNRRLAQLTLDVMARRGLVPARNAAVDRALLHCRVAGRHERVGQVLFDGAHTVAAARRLAQRLAPNRVGALVFGATSGRDAARMLAALTPVARWVVLTQPSGPRGVDAAGLASACERAQVVTDPRDALCRARRLADGDLVLVTGSLHLVGELLQETSP